MLTHHERHSRLVKIVRRWYQTKHPGSKIFNNTSGSAWQGEAENTNGFLKILNPRPIKFGIPEPDGKGSESGGADLLGETLITFSFPVLNKSQKLPIITGIEVKTGKSKLKKNQINFRNWMKSINAIWYLARECTCWESWDPVKKNGKILSWEIPSCPICDGKGFILFDE